MQKAITKKKSKAKGVSQLVRKHSVKGKSVKRSAPGHRKLFTGTNEPTVKHLVPFALKAIEKQLPYLTVVDAQGELTKYGDQRKQLQIIKDVYPVISSMKGFKVVEFDHFKSTAEVLTSLISQFDSIGRFEQWSLEEIEGKHKLKAMNIYGGGKSIHIAVDFLSQINMSHKKLHDFIIYALRLVQNVNSIPVFHDWCADKNSKGMVYEWLWEKADGEYDPQDEEVQVITEALEYYGHRGIPNVYSKLLRGVSSIKIFKSELEKFTPSNNFERYAQPFLRAALVLAETKKIMHDYCNEAYEAGEAKPYDYMQVIWSWDDDDLMYQTFNEYIDSMAHGCGVSGFCWEAILEEGGFANQDSDIDFCDKCEDFFRLGNEMAKQIKKELNGVCQQSPLPLNNNKNKNGRKLIDILL